MSTRIQRLCCPKRQAQGRKAARVTVCLLLALSVAACSTPDRRTEDQRAADRSLAEQVHKALLADADLYSAHIDVQARSGVVWLTGWVTSADEARAARQDTKAVPGVQSVVDQIDINDWTTHY
jgi:osmotically-inducible protein OsmY